MSKATIIANGQQPDFLPMTPEEMKKLGWERPDILLISGDSYIDHPSFGIPLLGRVLAANGFKVALICQPDWTDPDSVKALGRPKLYAGISAGALDSMVAHYTAFRKKRSDDAYTPGGKSGARPNRACIVYTNLIKKAFPGLPVILGGIEASLRRISHYDFWTDKLRKPILFDSKADLVVYGMGERAMLEAAVKLNQNGSSEVLKGIRGTAYIGKAQDLPNKTDSYYLPSHQEMLDSPQKLMEATMLLEEQVHGGKKHAVQPVDSRFVILTPPAEYLETEELDWLYSLPFKRKSHPAYTQKIPAETMIRFSITSHRGCGGGCSFCSIALHQGRHIRSRSKNSILSEAESMASLPFFDGSISDVGGPSANMWMADCALERGKCNRKSCLVPNVCPQFKFNQGKNLEMLRDVNKVKGIKHVRVASGVRFDLGLKDRKSLSALFGEFVGGQLKVAPEHISPPVLKLMRKPNLPVFEDFLKMFQTESDKYNKEQYVIPYLMSAFPGCTDKDMQRVGEWFGSRGWKPRQVQCFIPTPGTVATAMFYSETDPSGNKIFVARSDAQRLRQHAILVPDIGSRPDKHQNPKHHSRFKNNSKQKNIKQSGNTNSSYSKKKNKCEKKRKRQN
jgi:uncharacterized radical SAM protein YgiQ